MDGGNVTRIQIGDRFSRWTVLALGSERRRVICECQCGARREVFRTHLKRGMSKSCGCLAREISSRPRLDRRTHAQCVGGRRSSEYMAWESMRRRCANRSHRGYPNYGGRGITVCDRWCESFENFYADMGPRLSPTHSIDRIDNNGNYDPLNCRWATRVEQARNKRNNVPVIIDGKTKCAAEWASTLRIAPESFHHRMKHWPRERWLEQPRRYLEVRQ